MYSGISSAIKNKGMSFAEKWIYVETITLNELSKSQKDKYCVFYFICLSYILYKYIGLCMYIWSKSNFLIFFLIWSKSINWSKYAQESKEQKGGVREKRAEDAQCAQYIYVLYILMPFCVWCSEHAQCAWYAYLNMPFCDVV